MRLTLHLMASDPRPSIGASVYHAFSATDRIPLSHGGAQPEKGADGPVQASVAPPQFLPTVI
jgi:hypothetical protein